MLPLALRAGWMDGLSLRTELRFRRSVALGPILDARARSSASEENMWTSGWTVQQQQETEETGDMVDVIERER